MFVCQCEGVGHADGAPARPKALSILNQIVSAIGWPARTPIRGPRLTPEEIRNVRAEIDRTRAGVEQTQGDAYVAPTEPAGDVIGKTTYASCGICADGWRTFGFHNSHGRDRTVDLVPQRANAFIHER